MFRKIAHTVALIADLAPGAGLIIFGAAVIIASSTGALWH